MTVQSALPWDPSQLRVLAHDAGPLLVLGAAGTGKTALMVEMLARRMRSGAAPALGLCLTRQAASEVRDRVTRASGRTSVQPSVMTLHALCLALAGRYLDESDAVPVLLTAPEQEFRLRELLAGRGASLWPSGLEEAYPTRSFARQVRAALARARHLGLDPEDVARAGASAAEPAWAALGAFMDEYLDVLDAEQALDYAELVHRVRILLTRPDVLDAVRRQFGAVYVDDFAELDPAQLGLIRALVPDGGDVIAFADPDSAIFRFRGAHPRATTEFVRMFGGELVTLDLVHRCPAEIVAAARGVADRLPAPALGADRVAGYRAAASGRAGRGRVEILTFPDEVLQARRIAAELRAAHLERGRPWSEMAVLVRSGRSQIPPLARALTDADIPVEVAGDEIGLADELAVRPLLLALSLVGREVPPDADEAHRLLTSGWGGLDAVALRSLGRALRRAALAEAAEGHSAKTSGDLIAEALTGGTLPIFGEDAANQDAANQDAVGEDIPIEALTMLADRRAVLDRARAAVAGGRRPDEVLWLLWDGVPWRDELRLDATGGGENAPRANRDLDAVCALFDLARDSSAPNGTGGVRAFLAEVAAQQIPADMERESAVRGRGVRVMTAHRSKGREWPFVVVAGVQEGVWPDVRRRGSLFDPQRLTNSGLGEGLVTRDLVATERRLFHLAVTRASEVLMVTAVAGTDGEADQPSRFLAELGVAPFHVVETPVRLHTLRQLVASLRAASEDEAASPELRAAAASRLAQLAEATDGQGRGLVPDADPERWWGVREVTSLVAVHPGEKGAKVVLTPSQLASVLACPRQYFLAREARAEPPRSSSALLGSVIHTLAEHSVAEGLTREDALECLDRVWDEIPFPALWLSQSERMAAEQAVYRFMSWQEARDGADVVGVEVPFRVDIEVDGQVVTIAGAVDRLEREASGALRVVDFKSARVAPYQPEVNTMEQLGLYQLAIEAGAFGEPTPSAGAELVYLRLGDDLPKVMSQRSLREVPHVSEDSEELAYPTWIHQRIAQAARVLACGRFDATPSGRCQFCAFVSSCPAKSGQVIA